MVSVTFDANGNKTFDVGDDAANLVHDDQPMDMAYTQETRIYKQDNATEIGGVINVDGASEWEAGVYTFELSKPLNSGDSAGYDIAISTGDEILAEFIYVDASEPLGPPPEVIFMLSLAHMHVFTVQDGYAFNVTIASDSAISDFNFSESLKQISFNVTCLTGMAGYCDVTIPKYLLQGEPWIILLDSTDWTTSCSITGNDTHTFIYIPYSCSTNTIQIIGTWAVPEFPSAMILPLLMIATMVSAILCRRRRRT